MINAKREAIIKKARARGLIVQAVYQYLIAPEGAQNISKQFMEREITRDFDRLFFDDALTTIITSQENFEEKISPFLDRDINSLGYVERAILLIAYFEFKSKSAPAPVIINEAIILAKKFGAEDSHKFINGVLDRINKKDFKN